MIKGLIFDMDGVIIDSEPIYRELNAKLFEKLGFSLSDEEYSEYVGTTDEQMLSDLKEKLALEKSVKEMDTLREKIHMDFFQSAELYPMDHLLSLLDFALKKELKLAVASSTHEKFVRIILEKTGVIQWFKAITCGNHIENSKPAPDIFILTAQNLGLKPEECLVIEDSKNGVTAGKSAGMPVIGFQSDDGSQDLSMADELVHSLDEIIPIIEKIT